MATFESNDGTLSHSFCSSFMASGDSRSGRMDSAWPSLMYAGPRLVTMLRRSMARDSSVSASRPASASATSLNRKVLEMAVARSAGAGRGGGGGGSGNRIFRAEGFVFFNAHFHQGAGRGGGGWGWLVGRVPGVLGSRVLGF